MLTKLEKTTLRSEFDIIIKSKRYALYKINTFRLDYWRLFNENKHLYFMCLVVQGFSMYGAYTLAKNSNYVQVSVGIIKYRISTHNKC